MTIALDIFGTPAWSGVTACTFDDADATSPIFLCWDQERGSAARDLLLDWLMKDARALA